jgi:dipeptidyl aminopeptidase/acylaminoacyl peptidase
MKLLTITIFTIIVAVSICVCVAWRDSRAYKKAYEENTIQAYRLFLQKFPKSKYRADVQNRMGNLVWNEKRAEDTVQAYQTFLRDYPKHRFAAEAQKRLSQLIPILFYSDMANGIVTIKPDGSEVSERIGPEGAHDPDWSPDCKKIAFVKGNVDDGWHIYIMNADGTDVRQLTKGKWPRHRSPDWSPDGKKIVFTVAEYLNRVKITVGGTPIGWQLNRTWGRIVVIDADGSNQVVLYDDLDADNPMWSPDGRWIAFEVIKHGDIDRVNEGDIYQMNADGSGVTPLKHDSDFDNDPAWSPDSRRIAFVSKGSGVNDMYQQLHVMNADGAGAKRLTHFKDEDVEHPSWSPDGNFIVFSAGYAEELYVIRVDGSGLKKFSEPGSSPTWSP